MSKLKAFIYSVSILSCSIIGAGFFSLPYITAKVGIGITLAYFIALGFIVILVHLFFGELALKTPDFKRLPGFAKIYLGKWGERIAMTSIALGFFGVILAYLIVGGKFLNELLSPTFGGNTTTYTLFYFAAGAILIYFGIKAIAKIDFMALILIFLILGTLFIRSSHQIKLTNFSIGPDFSQIFLAYGPILFALWGASIIPEAEEVLKENKKLFKKVIIIGTLIPVLIYLAFIFLILGVVGNQVTESALVGLRNFLSNDAVSLALLFGILAIFTSFISSGLTLKNVFHYDFKFPKTWAWAITCFIPLILFFIGVKNFIQVISLVGGVTLGIDGILIMLMYRKIKTGVLRHLTYPLILVLVIGIIYEIIYFIK